VNHRHHRTIEQHQQQTTLMYDAINSLSRDALTRPTIR